MTYRVVGIEADKWMEKAFYYLGQKEVAGSGDNPIIREFFKKATGKPLPDSTPWCAAFEDAVWFDTPEYRHIMDGSLWALDGLKNKHTTQVARGDRQYGDIVCFRRDGGGHIGFYLYTDANGNIVVLGGNQSDMVKIATFADNSNVVGYRRPTKVGGESLPNEKNGKLSASDFTWVAKHVVAKKKAADHDGSIEDTDEPEVIEAPKKPEVKKPSKPVGPVFPTIFGAGGLLALLQNPQFWALAAVATIILGILALWYLQTKK